MNHSTEQYNLRVLVDLNSAYLQPCALKFGLRPIMKCPYPGIFAEVFDLAERTISKSMNITKIFGGRGDANPTQNAINALRNSSIDTSTICWSRTSEREKLYKFNQVPIVPFHQFALAAAADDQAKAEPIVGLQKFATVFEPCLWLAIVFLWVTVYIYRHYRPKIPSSFELHKKLLVVLVAMLTLFSLDLYANGLLTRLVLPMNRPLFEDTVTLAAAVRSGSVNVIMHNYGNFAERIKNAGENRENMSEISPTAQLAAALSDHPSEEITPYLNPDFPAEKLQNLIDRNYVFLESYEVMALLAKRICKWRIVQLQDLGATDCWFMFSKHTPDWVIRKMDTAWMAAWDMLEPIAVRYDRQSKWTTFPACAEKRRSEYVFTVSQFLGAFMILCAGLGTAAFGLVGEKMANAVVRMCRSGSLAVNRSQRFQTEERDERDWRNPHDD